MIDASEPDLEERFHMIGRKLAAYGAGLDERLQLVVLNKIDLLVEAPGLSVDDPRLVGRGRDVVCDRGGIDELRNALFEHCPPKPSPPQPEETVPEFLEYTPRARHGPRFRILRTDRGYRVVGTPPPAEELEDALRVSGSSGETRSRSARRRRVAVARTGMLGGVFDPRTWATSGSDAPRSRSSGSTQLLVLVVADPGHKAATTPAETRLALTRLAFEDVPEAMVVLDGHSRTVDSLEERRPDDAVFILGADELASFESWKSPERVLGLVRLAVAMLPGRLQRRDRGRPPAARHRRAASWSSR